MLRFDGAPVHPDDVAAWTVVHEVAQTRGKFFNQFLTGCRNEPVRAIEFDYVPELMPYVFLFPHLEVLRLMKINQPIVITPDFARLNKLIISFYNATCAELPADLSHLHSLKKLELYWLAGETVPAQIFDILTLERLVLSNCRFQVIPPAIGQLQHLTHFQYHGKLCSIPVEFGQLSNLRTLMLTPVHAEFPFSRALNGLTNLETLEYDNDVDTEFPPILFQQTSLRRLKLHGRQTTLSPAIAQLTRLEHLTLMCPFRALPDELFQLPNLQTLFFWDNCMTELPPSATAALARRSNLFESRLLNRPTPRFPRSLDFNSLFPPIIRHEPPEFQQERPSRTHSVQYDYNVLHGSTPDLVRDALLDLAQQLNVVLGDVVQEAGRALRDALILVDGPLQWTEDPRDILHPGAAACPICMERATRPDLSAWACRPASPTESDARKYPGQPHPESPCSFCIHTILLSNESTNCPICRAPARNVICVLEAHKRP